MAGADDVKIAMAVAARKAAEAADAKRDPAHEAKQKKKELVTAATVTAAAAAIVGIVAGTQ
jgi:hypothetical protein